ncbi:putative manganese-dependent inorganic diphosphatase [Pelagicoccus sp. SDUM812003]|uniref:putative manganese-dependent inorganic diphosphatase n=1 Tax=Pelagicoccus sp. SDUM812003 TaxID=3041267 RepID=UPI00280FD21F|nr:putative manganese-dependent inorganic diphosphatase [Pelagicoccus sp. SDUM812003]MDQ8205350.1 putative manganese-dependent inorganic diphosphatase [Pelagicoccus sp. SDUM812003]
MPSDSTHEITYVIGHKNPDADSICSAIAYANLKSLQGQRGFIPARCGNTNARIDTILSKFNQPTPLFVGDVSPRVKDIMVKKVVKTRQNATLSEALQLIDEHDVRVLPVVTEDNILKGFVSIFQMGDYFIPKFREPRSMRHVYTSINDVAKALQADVKYTREPDSLEDMYVKIGAMDIRSFGKFNGSDAIQASQTIIIVGDRWDIQQRSIQIGVRLLVVTGGLGIDNEVLEQAKNAGVSLIVSPYDSATTAWAIRTASKIERLIETNYTSYSASDRLSRVSRRIASSNAQAFMVTDDEGHLTGIFTKTDVLKPIKTNLVLVDHNEMGQAVPGASEVNIKEVIDHHRLGSMNTQQPILFINEPVGSTCTIVADLFRRNDLEPSPDIAGIMMSGIITDTLNLNGPTSTDKDSEILSWLESIAGIKADDLATEVFSSGSVILSLSPDQAVVADQKFYEENGVRYSVSQIEELGFQNFWKNSDELSLALENFVKKEGVSFACMLVTDINRQNSLLLVKGDPEFIDRIPYPPVEIGVIYDLQGVVSRKKQLIPFISSALKGSLTSRETA